MAGNTYQRPSLTSILSTLSQFTTQTRPTPARWAEDPDLEPERVALAGDSFDVHNPEPGLHGGDLTRTTVFSRNGEKAKPPPPNPATIIEWPAALRCVMRTVAPNEASLARMRKMIKIQHDHEREWWDAREALLKKQKARIDGREMLNSVLVSIGGQSRPSAGESTEEEDGKELTMFDSKVHRASIEMVGAMSTELKGLGVPFFGVPEWLMRHVEDATPSGRSHQKDLRHEGEEAVRLTKEELLKLQRRMLELLEDMCQT